jgi:WD40 repeat protein
MNGTARVWSATGELRATLESRGTGMWRSVSSVAFSPDGQRVVTASNDKMARVWSAEGELLATLQGHSGEVQMAAFSPDGQRVVTASKDKTARVWSAGGRLLATLQHSDEVESAAFSPEGERLMTASRDGKVYAWPVSIKLLGERLEAATRDCLIPEERQQYLDESPEQAQAAYARCELAAGRRP